MKNIWTKIDISPFFLVLALLFLLSGLFSNFIIFSIIIIVHELGHIITGIIFKDQFIKIKLYPVGGIVTFNEGTPKRFWQTMLILVSGFISQTILYYLVTIFYSAKVLDYQTFEIFETYYYAILLFNLLPIMPLDGGLIVRTVITKFSSYYRALKTSIWLSYTCLISIFGYLYISNFEVSLIYSFLLLTYLIYLTSKGNEYEFQMFLIRRIDYPNKHPINLIKNEVRAIKKYKHNFAMQSKYIIDETDIIKQYFKLT